MSTQKPLVNSTAGAIPVRNQKGEITMEKVKVVRYKTGMRPEYALYSSEEEDNDHEENLSMIRNKLEVTIERGSAIKEQPVYDRRMERLTYVTIRKRSRIDDDDFEDDKRSFKCRGIILEDDQVDEKALKESMDIKKKKNDDEEEEMSEEAIQRRREFIRAIASIKTEVKEEMEIGEEAEEMSKESDESEYEEYTDEEDRLEDCKESFRPIFISKEERSTLQQEVVEGPTEEQLKQEKRLKTLKELNEERQREMAEIEKVKNKIDDLDTGDEDDEEAYQAWKVRELKRQKRHCERMEKHIKEKEELERRRNLTEMEKVLEDKLNPKVVTNKAAKSKYKFLQRYYHRGAFYIDREEDVLKRDTTAPTLEDHFDKTVLPKAMQVKNFGKAGRTRYTHLVDQDTTKFDCPWTHALPVGRRLRAKKPFFMPERRMC